jgi:MAC/Perforin domain
MPGQTQAVALGATGTRTIYANPRSPIDLGSGFNTITQSSMNEAIETDGLLQKSDPAAGQNVKLELLQVESMIQMKQVLEIDATASYSNGFGISMNARASYVSDTKMSMHNVYLLVHVQVTNSTTMLKQPYRLAEEIKAEVLKEQKDPAYLGTFFRRYGDSFVTGYTTGGEFIAIVEFEAKDEQDKKQISAQVSGAVSGWSISGNFKSAMDSLSQTLRNKISVYRNGGKGQLPDLGKLVEAALKFPEEVLNSSIQLSFNTNPYDLVFPSGKGPSVLAAQSALEHLGRLDDRATSMGSQLENIKRFPRQYPAGAQNSLQAWGQKNEALRIEIRETARGLLNDPLGPISSLDPLLQRVNALENEIPNSPGGIPALVVRRFDKPGENSAKPGEGWRPEATLFVGEDYKILGGGARAYYKSDDIRARGNFLTASYPQNLHTWYVRAKDHEANYTGYFTAYAIALHDPNDLWDVVHVVEARGTGGALEATARLRDGYLLTGGGAFAQYGGVGSLITASYPEGNTGWTARCKSWRNEDNTTLLHAYAIGLKPRSNVALPPSKIFTNTVSGNVNSFSVKVDPGYTLVGGGVKTESNIGHVIIENYPSAQDTWAGASRDHWVAAVAPLTVFAIGIQV